MTPDDSLVLVSQQRENEGRSGTVGHSSSPGPLDCQELLTPRNVGQVSTDFSLGSQTSFNDMGSSISPPVGGSSGTNPFNTHSVSFSETERMSSEAGNEPVEYEDVKIQLKLPPQFGKEAQVLCVTEPHDIPGEFTMEFHVVDANFGKISLWLEAPESVQ
jgi:hypothetical protein